MLAEFARRSAGRTARPLSRARRFVPTARVDRAQAAPRRLPPPEPVHARQPVLRLRLRRLRDARRLRHGGAVHRRRDGPRHARRPLRAPDRHVERVRRAARLAGRRRLVRDGAGRAVPSRGACGRSERLGWAAGFIFVTAAAMRLARFNIQTSTATDKRYFVGMPSPAGRRRDRRDGLRVSRRSRRNAATALPALAMVLVPAC